MPFGQTLRDSGENAGGGRSGILQAQEVRCGASTVHPAGRAWNRGQVCGASVQAGAFGFGDTGPVGGELDGGGLWGCGNPGGLTSWEHARARARGCSVHPSLLGDGGQQRRGEGRHRKGILLDCKITFLLNTVSA